MSEIIEISVVSTSSNLQQQISHYKCVYVCMCVYCMTCSTGMEMEMGMGMMGIGMAGWGRDEDMRAGWGCRLTIITTYFNEAIRLDHGELVVH